MRDVLIEHLDGKPVPLVRNAVGSPLQASRLALRRHTTRALLGRGLLKCDDRIKSRHTYITDAGRAILAAALADWADALVRANFVPTAWTDAYRAPLLPRGNVVVEDGF